MTELLSSYPFRLGTTSYIIPEDLVNNAYFLASKVNDIELILFNLESEKTNFPDEDTILNLNRISREHDLTYTVHLPKDLQVGDHAAEHISLIQANTVIQSTRQLSPWAYITHLDGREIRQNLTSSRYTDWIDQACYTLQIVGDLAGGMDKIALENLEGYPINFLEPVIDHLPISLCVDIGHLWLDNMDPIPYLQKHIARTKVIHLHGIHQRDHASLAHMPITLVDELFHLILESNYTGVLTLEVFNEEDFQSSMQMIQAVANRS